MYCIKHHVGNSTVGMASLKIIDQISRQEYWCSFMYSGVSIEHLLGYLTLITQLIDNACFLRILSTELMDWLQVMLIFYAPLFIIFMKIFAICWALNGVWP